MTRFNYREPGEFGEGADLRALPAEFPIKHDDQISSIPWDVIKPHEMQALTNHRQGLERLAAHGGLTPCEALAVIEGRPWERMAFTDARRRLLDYVRGASNDAPDPAKLNIEDLTAAIQMVQRFHENPGHVTRYQYNRLMAALERVKGRIE